MGKIKDKKVKDKSAERELVEKLSTKTANKSSTPTKKFKGQQQATQNSTAPLTILKREDNNPPPAPQPPHIQMPNIEEVTRKLFKKQEANIQNEIQRSIK